MAKKPTQEAKRIIERCDYCQHNEGENKKHGFMWNCKVLGYCVGFGYKKKHSEREEPIYCKAAFLGKGAFKLDAEKKKEFDKKQNELKK